jgi:SAM-dependent methyltransferase
MDMDLGKITSRAIHDRQYPRFVIGKIGYKLMRQNFVPEKGKIYKVTKAGYTFELVDFYMDSFVHDWLTWEWFFTPDFSLKRKRVLDIGAGMGETLLFYLSKGAKEVICVEPSPFAFEALLKNVMANGRLLHDNDQQVILLKEEFSDKHLALDVDFRKIDCEKGESIMLGKDSKIPCALEVHTPELIAAFEKEGYRKRYYEKSLEFGAIAYMDKGIRGKS